MWFGIEDISMASGPILMMNVPNESRLAVPPRCTKKVNTTRVYHKENGGWIGSIRFAYQGRNRYELVLNYQKLSDLESKISL